MSKLVLCVQVLNVRCSSLSTVVIKPVIIIIIILIVPASTNLQAEILSTVSKVGTASSHHQTCS